MILKCMSYLSLEIQVSSFSLSGVCFLVFGGPLTNRIAILLFNRYIRHYFV